MGKNIIEKDIPFGLLEIDPAGAIRHYEPEAGTHVGVPVKDVLGRNFFDDIAAVAESEELPTRIREFWEGPGPAGSFSFTFARGPGGLRVRVLLARIRQCPTTGGAESLLVHIRPEAASGAPNSARPV